MFDGLWTVEFSSALNRYGRGVIVIVNGRILGGDDGYYYTGSCTINDNSINATITVIKYDQNSISVFGNINHFELILNGEINENSFDAIGTIADNPQAQLRVIGTKKEDL